MKMWLKIATLLAVTLCVIQAAPTTVAPLVVVADHESKPAEEPVQNDGPTDAAVKLPAPELYSMKVNSQVSSRYATTVVSSRVANPANKAQEVTFAIVIPETAFISGFLMELDGKVYKAYVKEKEEAKKDYQHAVDSGIAAAHVAVSARDSNRFTVSVNVEPLSKALFNLTYEELLTRRLDVYNLVVNLHPGQIVRELSVDVDITELQKITTLRAPTLRTGNEVDADENTDANPFATIEYKNAEKSEAHIRFAPTVEQQKEMTKALFNKTSKDQVPSPYAAPKVESVDDGLNGQFVVQYDVERDPQGGEVVVYDGYFVHFFAPTNLKPLNKHVVFVLDVSGSMYGSKIVQLKEAMTSILDELRPGDFFNLVDFSYSAKVYDLDKPVRASEDEFYYHHYVRNDSPPPTLVAPYPANKENIKKAKVIIDSLTATGGTNIYEALTTGLRLTNQGFKRSDEKVKGVTTEATTVALEHSPDDKKPIPEPIIIFLTDGDPTVGQTNPKKILSMVSELNSGPKKSAIFSLAFGDDADRGFLKQLSLRNSGFLRHIYEATDAAVQLQHFYKQIASPLLSNITFKYPADQVEEATEHGFHILFCGTELVVAGKLVSKDLLPSPKISGLSLEGPIDYIPKILPTPAPEKSKPSLERLWAYLTIKQLLDKKDAALDPEQGPVLQEGTTTIVPDTKDKSKEEALRLALKYSFVTPLTSLVVVKPNSTSAVDAEAATAGAPNWALGSFAAQPLAFAAPASGFAIHKQSALGVAGMRLYSPMPQFYKTNVGIPGPPGFASGFGGGYASLDFSQDRIDYDDVDNAYPVPGFPLTTPYIPQFYPTSTIRQVADLAAHGLDGLIWVMSASISPNEVLIPNTKFDGVKSIDVPKNIADFGSCNNTIQGLTGKCVPLSSCPKSFPTLTSVDIFVQYECNAPGYLAICCDVEEQKETTTA